MATTEQAQAITAAFINGSQKWPPSSLDRAKLVLEWCFEKNILITVKEDQLAAGMREMPFWSQGPRDYLDLAMAMTVAFALR